MIGGSFRSEVENANKTFSELQNGVRITFADGTLQEDLEQFISSEQKCCTFLQFDLDGTEQLSCEVTVRQSHKIEVETAKELIRTLFSP